MNLEEDGEDICLEVEEVDTDKMIQLPKSLSNICQICLVVRDIRKSMEQYVRLGVGPFKVYFQDTRDLPGVTYRAAPADYSLEVAWGKLGEWTFEILQPIRGPSIYNEFLDKHGEGLHHLGIYVDNYQAEYDRLIAMGYQQIQGGPIPGRNRVGHFDYFETERDYGTILELLDMPEDLGDPKYVYPDISQGLTGSTG